MLFDIYFNLGGFFIGLYTFFAHTTKAAGPAHAIAIAAGALYISIWAWSFRRHLAHHSHVNRWSLLRSVTPIGCYALGYLLPLAIA